MCSSHILWNTNGQKIFCNQFINLVDNNRSFHKLAPPKDSKPILALELGPWPLCPAKDRRKGRREGRVGKGRAGKGPHLPPRGVLLSKEQGCSLWRPQSSSSCFQHLHGRKGSLSHWMHQCVEGSNLRTGVSLGTMEFTSLH